MPKKILGICAALVALAALAIPASASAATTLAETCGAGKYCPLEVGKKITATQDEEAVFSTSGGTVVCTENWLTGEVHVNNDEKGITGTITAASFTGPEEGTKCKSSLLGPTKVDIPILTNEPKVGGGTGEGHWCIKNVPGFDKFEVLGRGCTEEGNGTLTFKLTGAINCTYTRPEGVSGTFTTTEEDPHAATLKVTGEPVFTKEAPSNFLCPAEGKITKMAFYLYTDTTNPSEDESNPVYITD